MSTHIIKSKSSKGKVNDKEIGFTLVELMVVVAVIGILVAIAVPVYTSNTEAVKVATDEANLRTLNGVTQIFFASGNKFNNAESDLEKMQHLVSAQLINGVIEPTRPNYTFVWKDYLSRWEIEDAIFSGSNPSVVFDFRSLANNQDPWASFLLNRENNSNANILAGSWEFDEDGLLKSNGSFRNLLYTKNIYDEYNIIVNAKLNENASGYGILIDSSVSEGRDSGYILQYETYRDSFGNQAGVRVVLRERYVGNNGQQAESGYLPLIGSNRSNDYRIPLESVDSKAFEIRNIEVRVRNIEADNRRIEAYLDGVKIFHYDYLKNSNSGYTGLRTWDTSWGTGDHRKSFSGEEARFQDMIIEPH